MAVSIWILTISLLLVGVCGQAGSRVPAMFIFGDSLSDPGNNNNLLSLAKANYFPNGIDFAEGVTGRFCNGRTIADFLGNELGLPLIPPFNNWKTKGLKLLHGVNYASAASGILDDTGRQFGLVWTMNKQIKNFRRTLKQLSPLVKRKGGVAEFVAESLILVCTGSNDYLFNYLDPISDVRFKYTLDQFQDLLIQEYTSQLKELHKLGGREFLVVGLGPLGCIPHAIGNHRKNRSKCVDEINEMASQFNLKLQMVVEELNTNLTRLGFRFFDAYGATMEIINNPSTYGFEHTNKGCCVGIMDRIQLFCPPLLPFNCINRTLYVFWDPYHPTEAFNAIIAKKMSQHVQKVQTP
ncbi:hypothetical protein AAC387_Pa06g0966 [Persea americana]